MDNKEHTSEAGHFYRQDGSPAYTMIGKNGKERPTTLRDARKENLVPSVTAIIRCATAPGLQRWLNEQLLLSAMTSTRLEGEPEQDYINRIIIEAGEQSKKARERGTQIHTYVQSGFEGRPIDIDGEVYYLSALETLQTEIGKPEWDCEKSFAFNGYGGKADLVADNYLVDIKTSHKPIADLKLWESHEMQLAAYDHGILNKVYPSGRDCAILYINSNTADSRLVWANAEQLKRGWKCFNALLKYWQAKNGMEE